jgi:hypothetical protein
MLCLKTNSCDFGHGMGPLWDLKQVDSFAQEGDTYWLFNVWLLPTGFGKFLFIIISRSFEKKFKEIFNKKKLEGNISRIRTLIGWTLTSAAFLSGYNQMCHDVVTIRTE